MSVIPYDSYNEIRSINSQGKLDVVPLPLEKLTYWVYGKINRPDTYLPFIFFTEKMTYPYLLVREPENNFSTALYVFTPLQFNKDASPSDSAKAGFLLIKSVTDHIKNSPILASEIYITSETIKKILRL